MQTILAALVGFLALNHLIYALQNLFNLKQAFGFVEAVLGQDEAPFYPRSMMPAIRGRWLICAALAIILALELAAGALLGWGAVGMWLAPDGGSAAFDQARQWALLGCGVAVVLWFGLFMTVGAALFQMWQTQLGQGAMGDAFRNGVFAGLVMLLLTT